MKYELQKSLEELGYAHLLPIQEKSIPQILNGKNLFIQASTGSGKTLAYLIPTLEKCDSFSDETQALIITPTRELALQVSEVANKLSIYTKHHIVTVIGGLDIHKQENSLKHHPTIIIGTPGRLKDLYDQHKINLSNLKITVLDEVDMIISTGQRNETEYLLKNTNSQIISTSATYIDAINDFMPNNYETIIQDISKVNEKIDSYYIECEDRIHSLNRLLHSLPITQCIIFVNYKNDANELSDWLNKHDVLASSFSSFYEEKERIKILKDFKEGKIRVLVATDAAARGLDITDISHIIHYDIPLDKETFIHRSGRTAHQGNEGVTITLIRNKDQDNEVTQYIKDNSSIYNPDTKYATDLSRPIDKQTKEVNNYSIIWINAGRKDKLRPKDIIGALCTKLDFNDIGTLEIQDSYSTVIITKQDFNIDELKDLTIKGKKRKVTVR